MFDEISVGEIPSEDSICFVAGHSIILSQTKSPFQETLFWFRQKKQV